MKIVVIVRGGLVQAIYTDTPGNVEADVIDLDLSDFYTDEEEKQHREDMDRIDEIEKTMTAIY